MKQVRSCSKCGNKLGYSNKIGLCLGCNPRYKDQRNLCACGCGKYCSANSKYYRGHYQVGKRNHNWNGGIKKHKKGYIYIKLSQDNPYYPMVGKNKYVFEHRYKVAKKIGRCLTEEEVVHHKNGIKNDNRLWNLLLCNKSEHDRFLNKTTKSEEDLKKILQTALDQGKKVIEIAEYFKVSGGTIYKWMKRLKVKR